MSFHTLVNSATTAGSDHTASASTRTNVVIGTIHPADGLWAQCTCRMGQNARLLGEGVASCNTSATYKIFLYGTSDIIVSVGNHSAANTITLCEPRTGEILGFKSVLFSADACLAVLVVGAVRISAADTGVLVSGSILGTVSISRASRSAPCTVNQNGGGAYEGLVRSMCDRRKTIRATSEAVKFTDEKRRYTLGLTYKFYACSFTVSDDTVVCCFRAASV